MITFTIQWAIYTAVLYLLYKLLLSRLTFFTANRWFLLCGLVFSALFALPSAGELLVYSPIFLDTFEVGSKLYEAVGSTQAVSGWVVIYFVGAGIAFLFFTIRLRGIYRAFRSVNEHTPSFSFFNWMYISHKQEDREVVVQHETLHMRKCHSVDILLLELAKIIQWFNPAVYLLSREMKLLHEYEVDAILHKKYGNDYGAILVANALHTDKLYITHSFGLKSLTKNRIKMMTKNRSVARQAIRYLAALPAMMLVFLLVTPKTTLSQEGEKPITGQELTENDKKPTFKGGWEALSNYLGEQVNYPEQAKQNKVEGKVFVSFVVMKDGTISNVKALKSPDQSLADEAVRVVKNMPAWEPGEQNGKAVNVELVLPVSFVL